MVLLRFVKLLIGFLAFFLVDETYESNKFYIDLNTFSKMSHLFIRLATYFGLIGFTDIMLCLCKMWLSPEI